MKKYIVFVVLFFVFFTYFAKSQEVLSGLQFNPTIEQHLEKQSHKVDKSQKSNFALLLPFFDDFKYEGPYPDQLKWSDKDVFINTGFQKFPANRGVATFDALDENGKIYENAVSTAFEADRLTSQKIRLDSIFGAERRPLSVQDSLYLSFYYQPQGTGNNPEQDDILELQFFVADAETVINIDSIYHPADTSWITDTTWVSIDSAYWEVDTAYVIYEEQWKTMWFSEGERIDTFYNRNGTWMKHVMIPIIDPSDLRPDFRFRFRNYASIGNNILPSWQSNMDQWNIDYVYLNYNRFWFDTTYRDVSFVNPGVSLLKNYTSMPYSQFKNDAFNAMKSEFEMVYSNLDKTSQNVDYSYRVYQQNGTLVSANYNTIEWSNALYPFINHGFYTSNNNVVLIYPIAPLLDSNEFTVKQWLRGDDMSLTDSVSYTQVFKNYYAYDDGTPEAGYGLTPEGSQMAIQFTLNQRDTLRAVDIFFNNTKSRNLSTSLEYFDMVVWSNNHGIPDKELYRQKTTLFGEDAGRFSRFYLDEIVPIAAGGVFIGIVQETDDNLNIGFDCSNDQSSKLFYRLPSENWKRSEFQGAVMFRPVFGKQIHEYPEPEKAVSKSVIIAPNPVSTNTKTFQIILPYDYKETEHELFVDIYNLTGQRIYSGNYTKTVTLGNVETGIYIVRVSNNTIGGTKTAKLIIL